MIIATPQSFNVLFIDSCQFFIALAREFLEATISVPIAGEVRSRATWPDSEKPFFEGKRQIAIKKRREQKTGLEKFKS
jgi:hypothetical protein